MPRPRSFGKGFEAHSSYQDLVRHIRKLGGVTAYVSYQGALDDLDFDARGWCLNVCLPHDTFEKLLAAIRDHRAHNATISIVFANLFGRIPYHHTIGTKLFLAPSSFSKANSDMGMGYVTGIGWRETPKPPETVDDEHAPPVDPLAKHQVEQATMLAQIAVHLKWLLWAVIAAVVILFIKR